MGSSQHSGKEEDVLSEGNLRRVASREDAKLVVPPPFIFREVFDERSQPSQTGMFSREECFTMSYATLACI